MAKSVAEFHARANLDSSEFDEGAANMSKSMYDAARSIDNAWGIIEAGSAKSAKSSAAVFARSGIGAVDTFGSQFDSAKIDQAAASNRSLTVEMDRVSKSARASAAVFEEAQAAATRYASVALDQAAASNRALTVEMSRTTNSARASAAVFEEHAAAVTRNAQQLDRLAFTQEKAHAGFTRGAVALRGMGQAAQFTSGSASRFGVIAQQVGYQVQDFAIQVAGGQNKIVAFAQQGSQLVSFFGPYGAIAGAVLNAGVMIYRLWDTATEKTDKAIDSVKEYQKVLAGMGTQRREEAFEALNPKQQEQDLINRSREISAQITAKRMTTLSGGELGDYNEAEQQKLILDQVNLEKERQDIAYQLQAIQKRIKEDDARSFRDELSYEYKKEQSILKQSQEWDKQSREEEDALTKKWQLMGKQADAILDQLDGTRKLKREAEEIAALPKELLSADQKAQALAGLVGPASIPQAMQVNAGASALGGTYGDGAAVLDIQREMLKVAQQQRDALNRMIQMWSTGSN
jgi:hypothetical protein